MSKFDINLIRELYYVWDGRGFPKTLLDVATAINADYYELIEWLREENKRVGAPVLDMHIVTAQKCEGRYINAQYLLDFKSVHGLSKRLLAIIFGYSESEACYKSTRKAPMWKKGLRVYTIDPITEYQWTPNLVAAQIDVSPFMLNKAIYEMTTVNGVVPLKMNSAPEKRTIELYDTVKYYAERYAKINGLTLDEVIDMAVTTRLLDLNL